MAAELPSLSAPDPAASLHSIGMDAIQSPSSIQLSEPSQFLQHVGGLGVGLDAAINMPTNDAGSVVPNKNAVDKQAKKRVEGDTKAAPVAGSPPPPPLPASSSEKITEGKTAPPPGTSSAGAGGTVEYFSISSPRSSSTGGENGGVSSGEPSRSNSMSFDVDVTEVTRAAEAQASAEAAYEHDLKGATMPVGDDGRLHQPPLVHVSPTSATGTASASAQAAPSSSPSRPRLVALGDGPTSSSPPTSGVSKAAMSEHSPGTAVDPWRRVHEVQEEKQVVVDSLHQALASLAAENAALKAKDAERGSLLETGTRIVHKIAETLDKVAESIDADDFSPKQGAGTDAPQPEPPAFVSAFVNFYGGLRSSITQSIIGDGTKSPDDEQPPTLVPSSSSSRRKLEPPPPPQDYAPSIANTIISNDTCSSSISEKASRLSSSLLGGAGTSLGGSTSTTGGGSAAAPPAPRPPPPLSGVSSQPGASTGRKPVPLPPPIVELRTPGEDVNSAKTESGQGMNAPSLSLTNGTESFATTDDNTRASTSSNPVSSTEGSQSSSTEAGSTEKSLHLPKPPPPKRAGLVV